MTVSNRRFSEGSVRFETSNPEDGTEFGFGLIMDGPESVSMGLAFLRQTMETNGMNIVSLACRALQREGVALVGVDLEGKGRDVLHAILSANFGGKTHKVVIDDGLQVEFYGVGTGSDIIDLAEAYAANITVHVLPAFISEAVRRGYAEEIPNDMGAALVDVQKTLVSTPDIKPLVIADLQKQGLTEEQAKELLKHAEDLMQE